MAFPMNQLRPSEQALRQAAAGASRNHLAGAISLLNDSGDPIVTRDTNYFRRRAAEARAAACSKDQPERVEVAGELALAYAALARRRAKVVGPEERAAIALDRPA